MSQTDNLTEFSTVAIGGWTWHENTFRVTQPDGSVVVVVIDRATSEWLGEELVRRAKRMVDR